MVRAGEMQKLTPRNPISIEVPVPMTPGKMVSSARTTPPSVAQIENKILAFMTWLWVDGEPTLSASTERRGVQEGEGKTILSEDGITVICGVGLVESGNFCSQVSLGWWPCEGANEERRRVERERETEHFWELFCGGDGSWKSVVNGEEQIRERMALAKLTHVRPL